MKAIFGEMMVSSPTLAKVWETVGVAARPETAMDQTPILSQPYLLPNQAQKHVTVNESLGRLDALVQLTLISRVRASAPEAGDLYILPAGASGDTWGAVVAELLAGWQEGTWVTSRGLARLNCRRGGAGGFP